MRRIKLGFILLPILMLLAACGGTEDRPSASAASGTSSSSGERWTALAADDAPVSADALFDWAEFHYRDLFPKGPATASISYQGVNYLARSYSGPWGVRYLGVSDVGDVWGFGDFTGQTLKSFGAVTDYSADVRRQACNVYQQACNADRYRRSRLSLFNGYAMGLRSDGAVLVWGDGNSFSPFRATLGAPIPGTRVYDSGVRAEAVGLTGYAAFVLAADGLIRGWGDISVVGGFSTGVLQMTGGVTEAIFPRGIRAVATNGKFLMSVRDDGTLWHSPGFSILDFAAGGTHYSAKQLVGVSNLAFTTASAGVLGSELAIGVDGSVWELTFQSSPTSGFVNDPLSGRAGAGSRYDSSARRSVGLPSSKTARCASDDCLALATDGTVWVWSRLGSLGAFLTPQQLPQMDGVVDVWVRGGLFETPEFLALDATGQLWLLNGSVGALRSGLSQAPERLTDLSDIVALAHDATTVLVLRRDGTVWGWGSPGESILGPGLRSSVPIRQPVKVPGVFLN